MSRNVQNASKSKAPKGQSQSKTPAKATTPLIPAGTPVNVIVDDATPKPIKVRQEINKEKVGESKHLDDLMALRKLDEHKAFLQEQVVEECYEQGAGKLTSPLANCTLVPGVYPNFVNIEKLISFAKTAKPKIPLEKILLECASVSGEKLQQIMTGEQIGTVLMKGEYREPYVNIQAKKDVNQPGLVASVARFSAKLQAGSLKDDQVKVKKGKGKSNGDD